MEGGFNPELCLLRTVLVPKKIALATVIAKNALNIIRQKTNGRFVQGNLEWIIVRKGNQ